MGLPLYSEGTAEPPAEDDVVLAAFAAGVPSGRSASFAMEGPVLMVDGAVQGAGYILCDENTLFAMPVAIQVLGLTYSEWDLWGMDLDQAFASLRVAAVGEAWDPVLARFTNDPGSAS